MSASDMPVSARSFRACRIRNSRTCVPIVVPNCSLKTVATYEGSRSASRAISRNEGGCRYVSSIRSRIARIQLGRPRSDAAFRRRCPSSSAQRASSTSADALSVCSISQEIALANAASASTFTTNGCIISVFQRSAGGNTKTPTHVEGSLYASRCVSLAGRYNAHPASTSVCQLPCRVSKRPPSVRMIRASLCSCSPSLQVCNETERRTPKSPTSRAIESLRGHPQTLAVSEATLHMFGAPSDSASLYSRLSAAVRRSISVVAVRTRPRSSVMSIPRNRRSRPAGGSVNPFSNNAT